MNKVERQKYDDAASAYRKHCKGDPLSDHEVAVGAAVFPELATTLLAFGPEFKLAAVEFIHAGSAFDSYQRFRKHP